MRYLGLITLFTLALAASAAGETYVVSPDGSGDYATIQEAVDAVVDGDVIELTDGTFRGDGNRDINYLGKAITVRSESGDAAACIIDAEGSEEEPRRGFLFNSGEGLESILEYVTVTGGYSPIALTVPAGGAINVTGSPDPLFWTSPTIRHCRFVDNVSPFAVAGVNFFISNGTITDCYFSGNVTETYDAAALCTSGYSNVTVERCVFEDNVAAYRVGGFGSGFFDGDVSVTTLNDCVFRGNHGGYRMGAVGVNYDVTAIMNRCLFEGNDAPDRGGAAGAAGRGAMYFNECTFVGNSSSQGAVLGLGEEATAEFTDCTMYGNMAADGSGLYAEAGCAVVVSNSIVSFGQGGAAVSGSGLATFSCCDVYGNEGGDWTDPIADQYGVNGNISEDPLFCDALAGVFTLRSDSPCGPDYNPDCGLIGAWPVGCVPMALDLKPGSCPNPVNTGSNGVLPAALVGTEELDVLQIDPATVLLAGVAPLRSGIGDVTTPIPDDDPCDCTTEGPDGLADLTLKFSTREIVAALGEVEAGEEYVLTVTGCLMDGTPFMGRDCVIIRQNGRKIEPCAPDPFHLEPVVSGTELPLTIYYEIPTGATVSRVEVGIYDLMGRLVQKLVDEPQAAGAHSLSWNGADQTGQRVPGGVYFCRLSASGNEVTKRVLVVR
jgi:hypothetical protein